jgi:hypothetical protein
MTPYEQGFNDCKKQVAKAMVPAIEEAILMEREACAKMVEEMASRVEDIRRAVLEVVAENIRARWQK